MVNKKDLYVGAVVYHSVFSEWGKGVVKQVRDKNDYRRRTDDFRDGKVVRYLIEWESSEKVAQIWCLASELNKTRK